MPTGSAGADPIDLAWSRFSHGDLPGAVQLARDAAQGSETPAASAALGFFLLESGLTQEAASVLLPAAGRWPAHAPLHWYAGYLHQRRGELPEAAQALRRACQLDATLDEAAFALAWVLHDLGHFAEAESWSVRALSARRAPPRLLQAGWMRQQAGAFEDASALYQEALQAEAGETPLFARLCTHMAQCRRAMDDLAGEEAALQRGLAAQPTHPDLLVAMAWHLHARGDAGGAHQMAREAVRLAPAQAQGWYLLGLLHDEQGEWQRADEAYAEAHTHDPSHVKALVRRARLQRTHGGAQGARWLLEMAQRHAPGDGELADLEVQLLLDEGDAAGARASLVHLLRRDPDHPERWRLLAAAHVGLRRLLASRICLARSLRLDRGNTEALRMVAWLSMQLDDIRGSVEAVEALLRLRPEDGAAHCQAALLFAAAGRLQEAQSWAERAVARDRESAEAWRALAEVRLRQMRLDEAEAAIRTSLRLAPGRVESLRQLGWICVAGRQFGRAQLAFLQAREAAPQDDVVALELAEAWRRGGDLPAALQAAAALVARREDWAAAWLLKARTHADLAQAQAAATCALRLVRMRQHGAEALGLLVALASRGCSDADRALGEVAHGERAQAWRHAVQAAVHTGSHADLQGLVRGGVLRFPEDTWLQSAALFAAALDDASDAAGLALQARGWFRGVKIRAGLSPLAWGERRDRDRRRPRVAYVASQRHHALLRRVLAGHDPAQVDVFVYAAHPIGPLPPHLRVEPLDPGQLADACAANEIDVVIDAGGLHPFEGQQGVLHAFARRLAPVQAGWLGALTTGGGVYDILLGDEVSIPPGHAVGCEEEVLRLEGGQWCWDPPLAAPPAAPAPMLDRGMATFGVVARSLRLGDASLRVFAQVLHAVPGSTLRFIGEVAGDWALQAHIRAMFETESVDAHRIAFDPFLPYADYLAWCAQVDVVLDTFPGSGGLSLLEPLWMGVPVVTRAGSWPGARQGASLLSCVGLGELVADEPSQYVRIAAGLVADPAALARLRAGLRAQIEASPLLDGRRIARQVEALCRRGGDAPQSPRPLDAKAQLRRHADAALEAWLREPHRIELPDAGAVPDLSVVIVLFNQAGLSRRMLQALADQRGASFETVIVDNASSDRTGELLARLGGARIVRNADNVGFLRAANQGAALARGRHIVLLNSDAFLQEGALAATAEALQADATIGALGGRVVLTAGGLQEAGNAIFRNALAGGIGRGEDPWCPAARAARSTDYVSGVFLATPRDLWRQLGGFDEAFAPAYYEDADYCVRVWQAGRRCVVDPRVTLEHVEWGSAVGNTATELMERNREVFVRRHAAWLAAQPWPSALPLDGDRWRSPQDRAARLPRVLMLDNEVPHMVRGGGLPRARLMLQALEGWPLTHLPLWTTDDDWEAIYASLPRSVEVALGQGLGGLESFLERRRGVYDVLLVSRPPNLAALQPLRQRRPELFQGMRLVYDAEAVFALREIGMAGVRGEPLTAEAAQARVRDEVELARDASDVIVVSGMDAACFERAGIRTHVISHAVQPRVSAPGPTGRRGLLFVGALHPGTPNEDGVLWFVEQVLPLVRRQTAEDVVLTIVGQCRSERVAALNGESVRVVGPQPMLEPYFDAARIFVAPARFAGGIPIKVIEAAAHGIPVVASRLLVRQLAWAEGEIAGADDAAAFAGAVVRLLRDDAAWRAQREAAWTRCRDNYDPRRFADDLRAILGAAR
jgi:GT2 family glycosyltransferase/tetratricopeptide (TPR) repeat protein/glycosyltransferase involved in cell wall biosynthesis